MHHITVLGVAALAFPWVVVVGAAVGKAVVARGQNDVVFVHNAGAHLCVGVLAALCRQQRHTHKIFVPADIISAFHGVLLGKKVNGRCSSDITISIAHSAWFEKYRKAEKRGKILSFFTLLLDFYTHLVYHFEM